MIIAHIINPVNANKNNASYLYYTQPITFESMFQAKINTETKFKNTEINLYTINYPEDDEIIPHFFIKLPYLTRSTNDLYPKISRKKLPILQDIFNVISNNIHADYYIFSNTDIILHKNFYDFIIKKIMRYNYDSIIINRRDNIPKFINNVRLQKEHLNLIFNIHGERHLGKDCFIIKKNIFKQLNMMNMFIAYPPWGKILANYLRSLSKNYKLFGGEYLTYHLGNDNNHDNSSKKNLMTVQNYINAKQVESNF